jgi:hypothetical protein
MSRQVITKTVTIAGSGYNQPARTLVAGQVVELSSAEQTAVTGAGGTIRATTARDQLGEGAAAANSN